MTKTTVKALSIKIHSAFKVEQRFRGGHLFSTEGKTLLMSDLDATQIAAIKNDPLLVVQEVDVDSDSDNGDAK